MHSWSVPATDLGGEVMVNSQAQSLLLESNKGRRALLTTRNFPVRPPEAGIHRHAGPAYGPARRGQGAPDAVSHGPRKGLVGRDSVRSLAHIPTWAASGPTGTLRSGALLGLAVFPVSSCRKAAGLTVMLHFWALRNKPLQEGCMWALPVGN